MAWCGPINRAAGVEIKNILKGFKGQLARKKEGRGDFTVGGKWTLELKFPRAFRSSLKLVRVEDLAGNSDWNSTFHLFSDHQASVE